MKVFQRLKVGIRLNGNMAKPVFIPYLNGDLESEVIVIFLFL